MALLRSPQQYSHRLRCGNILRVHPQINEERNCGLYTQRETDSDSKEMLPQATAWMNLEDKMLNEINQLQKDKCSMIALKLSI